MYQVKYKIWMEKEGKVFGKGPYDLLAGIKKYGSLAEAAKSIDMSYNKAFNLIKAIEKRLGYRLIITKTGGSGGGGSQLTAEAEALMSKYLQFIDECDEQINIIFKKHFG